MLVDFLFHFGIFKYRPHSFSSQKYWRLEKDSIFISQFGTVAIKYQGVMIFLEYLEKWKVDSIFISQFGTVAIKYQGVMIFLEYLEKWKVDSIFIFQFG